SNVDISLGIDCHVSGFLKFAIGGPLLPPLHQKCPIATKLQNLVTNTVGNVHIFSKQVSSNSGFSGGPGIKSPFLYKRVILKWLVTASYFKIRQSSCTNKYYYHGYRQTNRGTGHRLFSIGGSADHSAFIYVLNYNNIWLVRQPIYIPCGLITLNDESQ